MNQSIIGAFLFLIGAVLLIIGVCMLPSPYWMIGIGMMIAWFGYKTVNNA